MIVYRDLITGDEVLSDAFPLKQVVEEDGTVVSTPCLPYLPVNESMTDAFNSSSRFMIGRRIDVL